MSALKSSPRGVVFDLDGTLVDSYDAITDSLNSAARAVGAKPLATDVVRKMVGRGLESLIEDAFGADAVAPGVRAFRERYAEVYATGTRLLEGVEPALAHLLTLGIPFTLASNKPERFSTPILRSFGLRDQFVSVHGPDTVGSTKPEPTMIRTCCQDMELPPERVVYVGDMELDCESASQAGVAVALVATGSASHERLRQTGAPLFSQLMDWASTLT